MDTKEYFDRFNDLIQEAFLKRNHKFENGFCKDFSSNVAKSLPLGSVDFPNYSEEEIKKLLGQRWKANIAGLISLVEKYKRVTRTDSISVLSISSTTKGLVDIFGCHQNVSDILKIAKKIGLIKVTEESYRFGCKRAYAKEYAYNKQVEKKILNIGKEQIKQRDIENQEKLEAWKKQREDIIEEYINSAAEFLDPSESQSEACPYRFVISPRTYYYDVTDEQILKGLQETYPQLARYMQLAETLNQFLPVDERISFSPSITRSKQGIVSKIGIRATNPLVSLKAHENENPDYNGVWRHDMLRETFGDYTEIDVKSSVPRVAYLLKTGQWLGNEIDLYALMNGQPFSTPEYRQAYKNFYMKLYFDRSAKQIARNLAGRKQSESYVKVYGKESLITVLNRALYQMEQVIGPSIKSEIFLHESCIYMDVYAELLKRGYRVIQIYDGFFIQGQLSSEEVATVHTIIKEKAIAYYERFCKGIEKK